MVSTKRSNTFDLRDLERLRELLGELVCLKSEYVVMKMEGCTGIEDDDYYYKTPVTKQSTGRLLEIFEDGLLLESNVDRSYFPCDNSEIFQGRNEEEFHSCAIQKTRLIEITYNGEVVFQKKPFLEEVARKYHYIKL